MTFALVHTVTTLAVLVVIKTKWDTSSSSLSVSSILFSGEGRTGYCSDSLGKCLGDCLTSLLLLSCLPMEAFAFSWVLLVNTMMDLSSWWFFCDIVVHLQTHHRLFFWWCYVTLMYYLSEFLARNKLNRQSQPPPTAFSDKIHSNSKKIEPKRNWMMGYCKLKRDLSKKWPDFSYIKPSHQTPNVTF